MGNPASIDQDEGIIGQALRSIFQTVNDMI